MRVLGVDPGERRVGLALSDEDGRIALPLRTVPRGKDSAAVVRAIVDVVAEKEVGEVVVGLPLRLDGSEGEAARRARAFAVLLERSLAVPLTLWDERLTTVAAERSLGEMQVHGRDRKGVVDQAAATILLQSFLDSRTPTTWDEDPSAALREPPVPAGRRGRPERRRRPRGSSGR